MIDETPVTEAALEGELEILTEEIRLTEQQLEQTRQQHQDAMAAEHEAGEALRAAQAVFGPLLAATRQDDQQMIFAVGDAWWRASFPQAAQAYGQVQGCQQACQKAAALTDRLHRAVLYLDKQKLPSLRVMRHDKQESLAALRISQAHALEHKEARLKDGLDRFRKKLRGEKA